MDQGPFYEATDGPYSEQVPGLTFNMDLEVAGQSFLLVHVVTE